MDPTPERKLPPLPRVPTDKRVAHAHTFGLIDDLTSQMTPQDEQSSPSEPTAPGEWPIPPEAGASAGSSRSGTMVVNAAGVRLQKIGDALARWASGAAIRLRALQAHSPIAARWVLLGLGGVLTLGTIAWMATRSRGDETEPTARAAAIAPAEPAKPTKPAAKGEAAPQAPEDAPTPAAAVPTTKAAPGEASDLLRQADEARREGLGRAFELAEQSYDAHPTAQAIELMLRTACMLGDRDKARAAYAKVPPPSKKALRGECLTLGIRL